MIVLRVERDIRLGQETKAKIIKLKMNKINLGKQKLSIKLNLPCQSDFNVYTISIILAPST